MGKKFSQFTPDETKFLLKLHGRAIDIDFLARLMKRDRRAILEHCRGTGLSYPNVKLNDALPGIVQRKIYESFR